MKTFMNQFYLILFLNLANATIYWSTVSYTFNPEIVSDSSVNIFNDTDDITKLNISIIQIKDMEKSIVTMIVKQNSKKGLKVYDREIVKINADSCKLREGGTFRNFIVHAIYAELKQISNFRFSCPQRKGTFYFRNLVLPAHIAYFEKFTRNISNGYFELTIRVRVKPFDGKKLLEYFSVKISGVYTNQNKPEDVF